MNDLLNINLRLAALLGLPLIATFSFISQKNSIFRRFSFLGIETSFTSN